MITDSSFLPWQTWPEHPPVLQSLSAAQGLFVEVPQNAGSIGGVLSSGGAVSVHALVKIAAVNRRIMMYFMCCYWVS